MTRLLVLAALLFAPALCATVAELRITEVRPLTDTVEVTHTGASGFTQTSDAFFRFGTSSQAITTGTAWTAGEVKQFTVTGLPDTLSDLWLFLDNQFTQSASIIHGLKYGGSTAAGNEAVAVAAFIWPSALHFCPAPSTGQSLSYDGAGFTPQDWFIDETPSFGAFPDNAFGSPVGTTFTWPSGAQTFQTMGLGDGASTLVGWTVVDSSAANVFTIRGAADTYSGTGIGSAGSTRWLRLNDADAGNVQNRFYSPTVTAPAAPASYSWTWFVNIEEPIAAGATVFPRMVIQHVDGGFSNAWGVEFTNTAINLVVIAPSGAATASTTPVEAALFSQWVKLTLTVNFTGNTVALSVNNQTPISAAIAPSGTLDRTQFRWCYRGEGTGNACKLLVDDISFTGSAGVAPTINVTSNGIPVSAAQIITVQPNTALAALNLAITVNDPNANSTSLNGSVSNVTTQGILSSQFSSTSAGVPYLLTPTSGVFSVNDVVHSIVLSANDGQGNITTFAFSVAVQKPGGGGGGGNDNGGCTTASGTSLMWAAAGLVVGLFLLRPRQSAKR
ncbi:MAG: hypothetical protein KBG84_09705 [Planctomycetes bacterium]|nr:hypothetical protein [Planctomycetota bacterium]